MDGRWLLATNLFISLMITSAGEILAQAPSEAAVQSLSVEVDVDYYGADYRSFLQKGPDANECRAACAADDRCQAYTFLRPPMGGPTGKCHLKSAVPTRRNDACCISGRRPAGSQAAQAQPYDEFRPNVAPQPPPQAPPLLVPQVLPNVLGQLPAQPPPQPYDEFREQPPPPPTGVSPQPIPPVSPPVAVPLPPPPDLPLPPAVATPPLPAPIPAPPPLAGDIPTPPVPVPLPLPPDLPPTATPAPPLAPPTLPPVPPVAGDVPTPEVPPLDIPVQPLTPPTLPPVPPVAVDVPTPSVPVPSPSDVVETPGADLLFDFAFERPTLSAGDDISSRRLVCDHSCSVHRLRSPILHIGAAREILDHDQVFRLDLTGGPAGFDAGTYYSVPFDSEHNTVASSPALKALAARANAQLLEQPRKLGEKTISISGRPHTFVKLEGLQSTFPYWLRLMRQTQEGWRPEVTRVCSVPVCPADFVQ
ncbi:MAG: hypothetical protein GY788_25165 [bacterium]|nr:hypothetical protein [bacterium]